ncbi:C-C motif chemokine 19 [Amia ocellicauda]|uniref:C-C motif chemokine 19 n=1 Tax=Amia ocellicauda TaxID=2972642 RepID=UPI00346469A7
MAVLPIALLAGLLLSLARGMDEGSVDCCLTTSPTPIPFQIVREYFAQSNSEGCIIPAIVFITKRNRRLCAPPDAPWVQELIVRLKKPQHPHSRKKGPPRGKMW